MVFTTVVRACIRYYSRCGKLALDNEIVPRNPKYRRFKYQPGTHERIRIETVCQRPWVMANILSNGDVVPCCYDYDATMALGNIREQPFTEIWSSPAYCALRRKIYQEMHSIPKCHMCWVNFKLSRAGWFVESIDFTENTLGHFVKGLKRYLRKPLGRRIIKAAWRRFTDILP